MKKISYAFISIFFFFSLSFHVYAGASLSTSTSTVYKGSTFTTTVNLSGVASWTVQVSSSGPVSNCSIRAADSSEDARNTSKTYSVTCSATDTGTIQITLSGDTTTEDGNTSSISGTKTVKVVEKPASQTPTSTNTTTPTKSGNNDLSSLTIEGYDLAFETSKTNYSITVPYGTEKIQINASKSHDKASISGDGEKDLQEGENKFEVVVTAENGDKKTYSITVIVDSKPIEIKLDNTEGSYTMVKKAEDLPEISLEYEIITLTIEDQEVEAYRVDSINYVLVGLRDTEGNVSLYKFDSYKDDTRVDYTLYQEIKSNIINLVYMVNEEIPKEYKKETIEIGGQTVEAYKYENSEFYLVYGMNIETGEKGWYSYDLEEGTLQRYIEKQENKLSLDENIKYVYIGVSAIVAFFLAIIIALSLKLKGKEAKLPE